MQPDGLRRRNATAVDTYTLVVVEFGNLMMMMMMMMMI
jgi:hypothetical protein